MTARLRRSALFMPASNARAIEKAKGLDCDVVILDLEDAVAPEMKAEARAAAVAAVATGGFGTRELIVRVNGLDTEWGADDCAAIGRAAPDAILLPKVSTPADLAIARAEVGRTVPLWAMIETCTAIIHIGALTGAAAEFGLSCLIAGTNDLAKEMRCRPDAARTPLVPALASIVMAGRASGLIVLDGVCNILEDGPVLADECGQGAMLGFDGKTLIHPVQIAAANRAFGASDTERAWAEAVIAAFAQPENADRGAIRVNGEMIERLHLAQAERILG
jgi:citrate lyase subunit beta/citryl-CoA lyase